MNKKEENNRIDIVTVLEDFLKAVKKFGLFMLIGIAVVTAGFYIHARLNYQPVYQSQATFSVNTENSSMLGGTSSSAADQVKESLPYIMQSAVMKNMVIDDMGLNSFPAEIKLESKETANFFTLTVTADDAGVAYEVLKTMIADCPKVSVYVLGKISLEVLDEPTIASEPTNYLDKRMGILKGAALASAICVLFAFLYALTNHTIQREEDFKKYLSVSCIAVVPEITFKKRRKEFDRHIHIYNDKVGEGFREAFRTIRTRVRRNARKLGAGVIMITSSIPGEGKSTVASNLALSLAERDLKVVLVDLDLRNPSIGKVLGLEERDGVGITDILKREKRLEEVLQYIEEWNLSVLFAGTAQSDPTKLLSTGRIGDIVGVLEQMYDYVILDTPPAAMLADASTVARCADCVLYVVKQDYARIERIVEGLEALQMTRTPIIGAVLNDLEQTIGNYGSYRYARYGSKYGRYGTYGEKGNDIEGGDYVEM